MVGINHSMDLYVTLSHGRSTIWLLRDFNDKLFQAKHCTELLAEEDQLMN